MLWLDGLWTALAAAVIAALVPGSGLRGWLPWRALLAAGGTLLLLQAALAIAGLPTSHALQWLAAVLAAVATVAIAWWASPDLRAALRR